MKKHKLLKHAYDNYPKGIRFKCISSGEEIISNGKFIINGNKRVLHITENNNGKGVLSNIIDCQLKWATIVPEKTAVKVNNEFELEQMYKAFPDYKEMVAHYGFKLPLAIEAKGFVWVAGGAIDYNIIEYADFAKEKGLALKPTEVVLDYPTLTIKVTKDGFSAEAKSDTRIFTFSISDIESIHSAMKSLK